MAENSKIQWTDHTFNPWRGCTKVSLGCTNCYAETQAKRNPRILGQWGPHGTRVIASESYWKQPLAWDKEAKESGTRRRIFCASMADVFECRPELEAPRARLFNLIAQTPNLDWLLLTKRPENIKQTCLRLYANGDTDAPTVWDFFFGSERIHGSNIWLGVSVENQEQADKRIPQLLQIPAAVRFLSCEPLLEAVDLESFFWGVVGDTAGYFVDGKPRRHPGLAGQAMCRRKLNALHWVIVGGESGHNARPCDLAWIRSIVQQCNDANVACFVKQLGSHVHIKPSQVIEWNNGWQSSGGDKPPRPLLNDKKGGDPAEWPEDLRVREFPTSRPTNA